MLDYKYKTILGVAIPLMVSSFIQAIVYLTDASFLSRYSTLAFDASGNAGLLYVTVFISLSGMSDAVQILIARRIGQERHDAIGRIFGTSLLTIALLCSLMFCVLHFLMPDFLLSYSKHADLAHAQNSFLGIRSYALFFAIITLSINAFFFAIGKTWVVLISALIVAISNVVMGRLFIFGWDFIPEMGLEGAALASTCADGLGMLFLLVFLLFSKEAKAFHLFKHLSFQWKSMLELLKIGSPLFLQGFFALATWTVFFTWIEQMGKTELTVSQNIRAVYFLAFVPIWGFAATTKTYISQYIGKGDLDALKTIQRRIQLLTVIFLFVMFHGALFYPRQLLGIINPDETYLTQSAEILRYISGSILIFGLISVKFQTINGSGNTQVTFLIEFISVFIYMLASYILIKVLKLEIFWVWSVEYIYFITLGVLSIGYLKLFNWKKKKI
ncbi:MAG: MATE family efflux transporter [Flavobacteriia bacterium]